MGHMLLFNAVLMVLCTLYYCGDGRPNIETKGVDQAIHNNGTFQYKVSGVRTS